MVAKKKEKENRPVWGQQARVVSGVHILQIVWMGILASHVNLKASYLQCEMREMYWYWRGILILSKNKTLHQPEEKNIFYTLPSEI